MHDEDVEPGGARVVEGAREVARLKPVDDPFDVNVPRAPRLPRLRPAAVGSAAALGGAAALDVAAGKRHRSEEHRGSDSAPRRYRTP